MSGSNRRNVKDSESTTKPTARTDHSYTSTPVPRDLYNDEPEHELVPFECKDCKKVIHSRDSPAECGFCENNYCFKCSKVESKEAYKRLGSEKDEDGIMWFCYHCRTSFSEVRKMVCRVTKIEQKQVDLEEKQGAFDKRLEELESVGIENKVKEAITEQKERDIRKLNIMVFGLPESDRDTSEERNSNDQDRILNIASTVMELENPRLMFTSKPIRIGVRNPGKCRPLRLTIDSLENKKKIIEAARLKVKYTDDEIAKNVYFHPDLTKKQRNEAFAGTESRRLMKEEEERKARQVMENRRVDPGGFGPRGRAFSRSTEIKKM